MISPSELDTHIRATINEYDYTRMLHYGKLAETVVQWVDSGASPLIPIAAAIDASFERLEGGTTHAYAAAGDWIHLFEKASVDSERKALCVLEVLDHIAFDCARHAVVPFKRQARNFSPSAFLEAIDRSDEPSAVAYLLGALSSGRHFSDLEEILLHASLSHYTDYGHALIYLYKTKSLLQTLGPGVEAPLLHSLVRFLCKGFREDTLPAFARLGSLLREEPVELSPTGLSTEIEPFFGKTKDEALDGVLRALRSVAPGSIYDALVLSCAKNFLYYDERLQGYAGSLPDKNIGWLHYSHALTFGNALRQLCSHHPRFWKMGLLQLATFSGRVSAFVNLDLNTERWHVSDPVRFFSESEAGVVDHGLSHPIFACHRVKTYWAVKEELGSLSPESAMMSLSALNRFLHANIREKYPLRTVRQTRSKFTAT